MKYLGCDTCEVMVKEAMAQTSTLREEAIAKKLEEEKVRDMTAAAKPAQFDQISILNYYVFIFI